MLQWMGGSRRKVTTSRKSTQNRQRQYFEQRKRRQQQTSGFDNNVDVANVGGEHHEKPKSLDILSFLNLTTAAQECKSSLTNERAENTASPVKCHRSNCSPTNHITRNIPKYAAAQKEAKTNSSCHEVEYISPQKVTSTSPVTVPSSRKLTSKKRSDKSDNQKAETEQELSIFDLLGDDGPNGNSGGYPVQEAHVAFSVQGLGEMGIGTPVCSPQQASRVSINKFALPKPVRQYQSSKDRDYMNDLEHELSSVIRDMDIPPCGDQLELPLNKRSVKVFSSFSRSKRMSMEGCVPLDARVCQRDNFFNEESPFIDIGNEKLRGASPCFLDETFPDENIDGAAWKNRGHNSDFLRDETEDVPDFTFEYSSFLNGRNVATGLRDFNISELAAPDFKHQLSERDHDFINLDGKRYAKPSENWDFGTLTWSPFASEDAKDNMSLLSEESSSSIAVNCGNAKYPSLNSALGRSPKEYGSEFGGANKKAYNIKDMYAEGMKDSDSKLRGKILNGSGKHTRVINPSKEKPLFQSDDHVRFQGGFDAHLSSLFDEGFTSMDIDSGFNSFQRTDGESELASSECKYWSEDLPEVFPSSSLYLDQQSPCKKSKLTTPVKYTPSSSSLFSEKAPHPQPFSPFESDDSPRLANTGSNSRKPDITRASKMQTESLNSYYAARSQEDIEFPAFSGQGEISRGGEDESEVQPSGHGGSTKGWEETNSVGNNEFSSKNGKTVDAPCSTNSTECMEAENGTSGHSGETVKIGSDHGEVTSWAKKEGLDELGRCTNDIKYQIDGHGSLPFQNCNGGNVEKGDTVSENMKTRSKGNHNENPAYQVMLESYVLQLLCVQKVLREASEESVQKV